MTGSYPTGQQGARILTLEHGSFVPWKKNSTNPSSLPTPSPRTHHPHHVSSASQCGSVGGGPPVLPALSTELDRTDRQELLAEEHTYHSLPHSMLELNSYSFSLVTLGPFFMPISKPHLSSGPRNPIFAWRRQPAKSPQKL